MVLQNNQGYRPDLDRFTPVQSDCDLPPKYSLLSLCVHIGYHCNLKCPYCSSKNCVDVSSPINLNSIMAFLDYFQIKRIVLSGGEPFLYPSILACWLPKLKERGLTTFLATNGTMHQHLKDLAAYIDWVDVSLPATTRSLYLDIRKEDLFDDVLRFIQYAQECGIKVRISYTVSNKNLEDVFNLPSLVKSLNVSNVRISHTYGTSDGLIWTQDHTAKIKALFNSICRDNIRLYTPLSAKKLLSYQNGYPILTPSGDIFVFNADPENFICHIDEFMFPSNLDKLQKISEYQHTLFQP